MEIVTGPIIASFILGSIFGFRKKSYRPRKILYVCVGGIVISGVYIASNYLKLEIARTLANDRYNTMHSNWIRKYSTDTYFDKKLQKFLMQLVI